MTIRILSLMIPVNDRKLPVNRGNCRLLKQLIKQSVRSGTKNFVPVSHLSYLKSVYSQSVSERYLQLFRISSGHLLGLMIWFFAQDGLDTFHVELRCTVIIVYAILFLFNVS